MTTGGYPEYRTDQRPLVAVIQYDLTNGQMKLTTPGVGFVVFRLFIRQDTFGTLPAFDSTKPPTYMVCSDGENFAGPTGGVTPGNLVHMATGVPAGYQFFTWVHEWEPLRPVYFPPEASLWIATGGGINYNHDAHTARIEYAEVDV